MRKNLSEFNFLILDAPYDSEQLCCSLAIEGKVEAVFSTDMDCLVFGTPCVITKEQREPDGTIQLSTISLSETLKCLQLSFPSFVDLCIMCGCDFNQNIPKIGPKKSYDLIYTYKNIDDLPEKYDVKILEHESCRKIFQYCPSHVSDQQLIMKKNKLFGGDKDKSLERKWREGRFSQIIKQLPEPESKPYYNIVEKSQLEIIFV